MRPKATGLPFFWGPILLALWLAPASLRGADWAPPPWGLGLEELNRLLQEKNPGQRLEEDKTRADIELQYTPSHSLRIKRGKVTAWVLCSDPNRAGVLYGYAFEGKLFGRIIFFKDHPEIFPETAPRTLKERFPEGRIVRLFGSGQHRSHFEYFSETLSVFSTERGVYFYEPKMLEKVVKIEQGLISEQEQKIENEVKKMAPR